MSDVKPDCYCLGGDKAHYSEAKYQSLQRTYEQARDEAKHILDASMTGVTRIVVDGKTIYERRAR